MRSVIIPSLALALALALVGSSPARAESADEVMKRLRVVARSGDVDGFKRFVHPSKGLTDESMRIKRKHITEKYMLSAEFLKTARRDKRAVCTRWKKRKARCNVSVGSSGGHSYFFGHTKKGIFLLKANIFDG